MEALDVVVKGGGRCQGMVAQMARRQHIGCRFAVQHQQRPNSISKHWHCAVRREVRGSKLVSAVTHWHQTLASTSLPT
ncbi:hypothetical protein NU195Hw_Modified_526t1 [Hortaea werneckii]